MNNTLRNGFKVLEVLAAAGEKLSVKSIAETMGVPSSHACRLLKTLSEAGYIDQDPKSRLYGISLKILSLSNLCLSKNIVRQKVRPFLVRLSKQRQINTYLSVPVQNRPMIIDAIYLSPHNPADSALNIGNFNPIHCSASGKVVAAYLPENELWDFLASCPFTKHTSQTITSREKFILTLPEIRKRKVALTINERGKSVVATASPVFNATGELAGIIGAQLPAKENDEHKEILEYAEAVRETAEAASFSLGFAEYDNVDL